jgi:(p)ppGpp synthase/HD superfamily hydrolase
MFVNFSLRPIELEASDKVASMIEISPQPERDLFALCDSRLDEAGVAEVRQSLAFARSLKSTNHDHPAMHVYMSHPLRVAKISLQLLSEPLASSVSLALLHNVFEVSGLTEPDMLTRGYDERLAHGIRLLTIDRKLQYDPTYLETFYGNIESYSPELVLIKSVDRIDNLLAFQLIERTDRINTYMELSDRFITPMATRLCPELGRYHADLIRYMSAVGCDHSLKTRYDAFLAENS